MKNINHMEIIIHFLRKIALIINLILLKHKYGKLISITCQFFLFYFIIYSNIDNLFHNVVTTVIEKLN